MIDYSIITECYIDTNLIETIVPTSNGYNHQKGCGTVANLMQTKFKDKFAVGIIDKDKKELKYAENFEEIINIGSLLLYKHKNDSIHHYLIFIKPAIELLILENAASVNVSLNDYKLSNSLEQLTKRSKTITSKNDINFKNLFKELINKKAKKFIILATWIKYLKDNTYQVKIADIINITDKLMK